MNGYQRREVARRLVIERFASVVSYLHPDRQEHELTALERSRVTDDVLRVAQGRSVVLEEGDMREILLMASLAYASVEIPTVAPDE